MRKLRVFASISFHHGRVPAKGMNAATRYVASMTTQPIWSNMHLLKRDLVPACSRSQGERGGLALPCSAAAAWRHRGHLCDVVAGLTGSGPELGHGRGGGDWDEASKWGHVPA